MKNSISPYPENIKVNRAGQVFRDGRYLGYVDKVNNWGTDFLARPEGQPNKPNKFFRTRTEATFYLFE